MITMATLPARSRRHRHMVATVICHGVAPFEMAVPCEVFTSPLVYRRTFRRIGA
jgi:hypothetical protein